MEGLRLASGIWLEDHTDDFHLAKLTIRQTATNVTQQQQLINQLRFWTAKSIRTSTVILATFNAIAAFATAFGILYVAYSTRKRNARRSRSGCFATNYQLPLVQPAEVYPLVVSIGITIQGIVFAVAQSRGLSGFWATSCTIVTQFMLPAIFIVPYIQFVFAVETAIRSLRKQPFPARHRYTTIICLAIVGTLLLINFLVAKLTNPPDICFASLFWFVVKYSSGCFAVLLSIFIVLVVCTAVIFGRLVLFTTDVDASERVAASRMVYYLAVGIVSNSLIIPFFFIRGIESKYNNQTIAAQANTWSMVASVVANVTGLMTGGLHLFLRSKSVSAIDPRGKSREDADYSAFDRPDSSRIGFRPDSDEDGDGYATGPINGDLDLHHKLSNTSLLRSDHETKEDVSSARSYGVWRRNASHPSPLHGNAFYNSNAALSPKAPLRSPELAHLSPSIASSETITGESLEKGPLSPETPKPLLLLLPATTYMPGAVARGRTSPRDMSSLKPPPSLYNMGPRRNQHRRDSSMASSATVQIGLRLSNVDDLAPINAQLRDQDVYTLRFSSADDGSTEKDPWQQQQPTTAALTASQKQPTHRPSPLSNQSRKSGDTNDSDNDSDADDNLTPYPSPRRDSIKNTSGKTSPLVPQTVVESGDGSTFDNRAINPPVTRLSPKLVSTTAVKKLASPRGVGLAKVFSRSKGANVQTETKPMLQRTNSTASNILAIESDWI